MFGLGLKWPNLKPLVNRRSDLLRSGQMRPDGAAAAAGQSSRQQIAGLLGGLLAGGGAHGYLTPPT
jgi:hypothetical protein